MGIQSLFFDLDETLLLEEASVEEAFHATCRIAEERYGLDPEALTRSVRAHAKRIWLSHPTAQECMALGISSWEGLHARFEGNSPLIRRLREWAPEYRRRAWTRALAEHGVQNPDLARELAETFVQERAKRYEPFPDAEPVLEGLRRRYRLALITNGPPCLQREKLRASGLERFFEAVVISGELGIGKPDSRIFLHALGRMGLSPQEAVMVGNSLVRDVLGAKRAGLWAVWIRRPGPPDEPFPAQEDGIGPDGVVRELAELPDALDALARS